MLSKTGLYKHRVIPGHMGGTYEPSNIVLLTIKQHAAAHKKLFKNYGKYEDFLAWKALSGQIDKKELTAELELLRRKHISEGSKGHVVSAATRLKISTANAGKPKSLKHRASLSAARMGKFPLNKGKKSSVETNEKNRLAHLGKPWSTMRRRAYEERKTR